jgi:hypothetical protein
VKKQMLLTSKANLIAGLYLLALMAVLLALIVGIYWTIYP